MIPAGYEWPGGDVVGSSTCAYWLQPHDDGWATQLYMVIGVDGDGQHIIAEKCYLRWATQIVDALRLLHGEAQ